MRLIIRRDEWDKWYYHSSQFDGQQKLVDESESARIEKVAICLEELRSAGYIPSIGYDHEKFLEFRRAVKETFFVFWTAINPPMERLLYALSYILKPKNILGLGIFTGNPLIWSLGPALQNIYPPSKLVGVEIDKNNGRLCQDNMNALIEEIKSPYSVKIFPEDGFEVLNHYQENEIDLLYLDANGVEPDSGVSGKNINYGFLKKAYPKIKPGGIIMCHNAYQPSFRNDAAEYLSMTDDPKLFEKTATIGIDEMGLEFTIKKLQ